MPIEQAGPTQPRTTARRSDLFASLKAHTLLRKLEPRIMLDAAAAATAVDALHHDGQVADHALADGSHAPVHIDALAGLSHGPVVIQSIPNAKSVVFIDAGVQDPAAIEMAVGAKAEIVLLDASQDGLTQIAEFLAGRTGLDSVHIVSHGAQGELFLGASVYTTQTLKGFDTELAGIGASLHSGGDVLLYGCDVGAGATGDAFVHKFADLTHANIAASTDLTGAASGGGNWVLEDKVGAEHTAAIQATNWNGELGSLVTVAGNNSAVSSIFSNNLIGPGITASNQSQIGVASQFGTFDMTGLSTKLPLSQGIVMVTGYAGSALTTSGNTSNQFSSNPTGGAFTYNSNNPVTEANLNNLSGGAGIWSPAGFKFDFTASTNRIGFVFSFASEEYQNYVGSIFNDAFGFFIQGGTQYASTTNLALVPGKSEGISINTINSGVAGSAAGGAPASSWDASNSSLYIANANGSSGTDPYIEYNGLTKLLTVSAPVTAGTTYHMEISIGDAGDNALDSAVFFHNQGFLALTSASNNAYSTTENSTVSGNVISDNTGAGADLTAAGGLNVTAINGAAFGTSPITLASGAALTMHSDGTFAYDPTHSAAAQALLIGQSLTDSFTYTVTDSTGITSTATVNVTVTNTDHVPVANSDTFSTAAGAPVTVNALANDTDADTGDVLSITQVAGHAITPGGAGVAVTGGVVTMDASDNLIFTPTAGYSGAPSFTYTIDDGHHGTSTATVTGHVYAPPVAVNNTFAVTTDLPITLNVLGNDSDTNGFVLSIGSVDGTAIAAGDPGVAVTGGTVTMDISGNLTFTPDSGYIGSPSFTYAINDGHGGTATATVSGTVSQLNHPPVNVMPGDQSFYGGTLVLSTANGNGVQLTDDASATAIIQATISVNTGTLTLHQTTGLTFLTGDGTADATITIKGTKATINAALDGMTYTAPAGSTSTGHLTLTTNDLGQPNGEDIPNGSFDTTLVSVPNNSVVITNQSNVPGWTTTATDHMIEIWGTGFNGVPAYEGNHFAELNANQVAADVNTTQIPEGQPLDFSFAHRGRLGVDVMNVTVIDAGADGVFGTADDATLMNKTFSDGNTAWGVYDQPLGNATGNPIKLIFTSISAAGGNPSVGNFLDAVHLGTTHLTDTDTIALNKLALPAPVNDTFGTPENTPVTIAALANDTDANGFPLSITAINGAPIAVGGPAITVTGGTVALDASNELIFTPSNGYAGPPSFNYTVSDGNGGTATATVSGHVYAPPVAVDDTFGTAAGAPITLSPLANDTDSNAFALSISGVNGAPITVGTPIAITDGTGATAGTVTLDASNHLIFAPATGYAGTPSFTYTIDDGHGGTAQATINGTVYAPPAPQADTFHTASGVAATIAVLANDSDPNAFALTISQVNGTPIFAGGAAVTIDHGTVKLNTDGTLTYTPTAGFSGPEAFTYTVSDGHGGTATANVSGGIYPPPVAGNDSFTTAAGAVDTIPVLANDSDPNGFTFAVTAVNGMPITVGGAGIAVTGGAVTLDSSGNLVFTPTAGYSGAPGFNYTITDDHGGQATGQVNGLVYAPPSPANDSFGIAEGVTATIPVLANDTDVNGFALTVTAINSQTLTPGGAAVTVANGSVALTTSGTLAYTPNAGYTGPDSFSYTISDGHGGQATATVNGTVYAPPAAKNDAFAANLNSNVSVNVLANDSDAAGLPLSITAVNGSPIVTNGPGVTVTGGTVFLDAFGNLDFAPNAGFAGATSFTYAISDGHGGSATATVTGAVYGPPLPHSDSFTTPAGVAATITALANDTDPNNLPLSVTAINGTPITAGGASIVVAGGSVALDASGNLIYTPNAGYAGTPSFTYTETNSHGYSANAIVTGAVLAPPVLTNDTFAIAAGTPVVVPVLGNDADPNGFPLAVTQVNGTPLDATHPVAVTGGSVSLNPDGTLTFTPTAGYAGTPSFTYTADDGHGGVATATVAGTVWAPPAPANDSFAIAAGTPVVVPTLANDSDPNGFPLAVTQVNGTPLDATHPVAVTGGLVSLNSDGTLTFTPDAGYAGTPSFNYTVTDGHGGIATATVAGTVWAPPVLTNDTFAIAAGTPVVAPTLANDTDPNGFPLTVTAINGTPLDATHPVAVTGGSVSLNSDGTLTFTPDAGYAGTPNFTYTADDGHGGVATATVAGTVWAPPAPANDSFAIAAGTPVNVPVLSNDTDPNGFSLTVTAINGTPLDATHPVAVTGGSVSLNSDGTLTFTPDAGYAGTPNFTYTADDGHGGIATATVNGTVWAPPVPANDSFAIAAGTPVVVTTLANDTDPNGFPLAVTQVNGTPLDATHPVAVTGGSVSLNSDGTLTFTPTAGYAGTPSFTYTADDGHGGVATATVNGTVWAPPAPTNDSFAIAAGTPVVVTTLANDTDPNGFPLTVTAINGTPLDATHPVSVTGGSVSLNPDGTLTFTPAPGYAGTPSFTYTADDGHGGVATATVNGTVWAPPVPLPDHFGTVSGNPVTIAPLANDIDPNGFPLMVSAIDGHAITAGGPAVAVHGGSVTLDASGKLTFVTAPGFSGDTSFTYTANDGHGGKATTTITGKVLPMLNVTQQQQTAEISLVTEPQLPIDPGLNGGLNEYIHPVAGGGNADIGSSPINEHIRLVVEGSVQKLDQQYGAGSTGMPMRTTLGVEREAYREGTTVYEPLTDADFWQGLAPLDFGAGSLHGAHHAQLIEPMTAQPFDLAKQELVEPPAIAFSKQIAHIHTRFDKSALRIGADLAYVA